MCIKIKNLKFNENETGKTVVDYNFLGTNISRKTYVVKKDCRLRLLQKPHSHELTHTLIPLEGEHRLAFKDKNGELHIISMVPGNTYFIPPHIPHDIEMSKGILDSFYPVESYTKYLGQIKFYDEDFFKEMTHAG